MLGVINHIRDGLFSILYPTPCHICGELVESYSDGIVCAQCWEHQEIFDANICVRCGLGFQNSPTPDMPSERICNRCAEFEFSTARSCGLYSGALRATVLFLKTQPHLCPRVRRLIRQAFLSAAPLHSADIIIPVPLHPSRQKERGYNQAIIIASEIKKASRLPIDIWNLQRLKPTDRHRAGLDSQDRSKDMKKAFKIDNPSGVANKTVLLVDDVFTTGATLSECALVVKAAGAVDVKVFTIARVL